MEAMYAFQCQAYGPSVYADKGLFICCSLLKKEAGCLEGGVEILYGLWSFVQTT